MDRTRSRIDRRDFLKLMGTFAATSAVAAACAHVSTPTSEPTHVVQTPVIPTGVPPEAVLPPVALGIISLTRMGYGPRPGDLDLFNGLGTTDEERLRSYVAQQLDPDSIDDSEFEARYADAGYETLHKSQEELYSDHIANNPYDSNDDAYWDWYAKPAYELVDATFLRAVYSKKQLWRCLRISGTTISTSIFGRMTACRCLSRTTVMFCENICWGISARCWKLLRRTRPCCIT